MVKLVDTLGSGSSGGIPVKVQVLFRAKKTYRLMLVGFFYMKSEDLKGMSAERIARKSMHGCMRQRIPRPGGKQQEVADWKASPFPGKKTYQLQLAGFFSELGELDLKRNSGASAAISADTENLVAFAADHQNGGMGQCSY